MQLEYVPMSDVVARSRFLAGIGAADVRAILAQATERRWPAGAIVTHQGTPAGRLFLIAKGRARYFTETADGHKILLRWLPAGEIFGGAALLAEASTYQVSTEMVRDTSVLVWTRAAIRSLAERYPRLMDNALATASEYLDWYLTAHVALSSQTAR